MNTRNIQFHNRIKKILKDLFLELSEHFVCAQKKKKKKKKKKNWVRIFQGMRVIEVLHYFKR